MVSEFVLNTPDSERRIDGIARMNYLHDGYRKAGKISDEDMLYTLGLFALEPGRWVDKYEWRPLSDIEKAGMGTFWKDMGESMGISYDRLEPYYGPYRDGLGWYQAIDRWSRMYEENFMVVADSNAALADGTLDILTFNTPNALKPFAMHIIRSLLEPRLRQAMR